MMKFEKELLKLAGYTLLFKYLTENFIFDLNSIIINIILDFIWNKESSEEGKAVKILFFILSLLFFLIKLIPTTYSIFRFSHKESWLFFLFDGIQSYWCLILMFYHHYFFSWILIGLLIFLSEYVNWWVIVILLLLT